MNAFFQYSLLKFLRTVTPIFICQRHVGELSEKRNVMLSRAANNNENLTNVDVASFNQGYTVKYMRNIYSYNSCALSQTSVEISVNINADYFIKNSLRSNAGKLRKIDFITRV